jgi:ribosome-associated protein
MLRTNANDGARLVTDFNDDLPEKDSKSKRKRDMIELQKIGEILVKLAPAELAKIPLDERLADAVNAARTITNHEGKRRQLQYIGKLMRNVDPEPIREAVEKIQFKHQHNKAQFHQLEHLRDKLIAEGDAALEDFVKRYPTADLQRVRQLIRNAQKDQVSQKNSGAHTELFRYLREIAGE